MPQHRQPFPGLLRQERRLLHQLHGRTLLRPHGSNLSERRVRSVHYGREQLQREY